MLRVLPHYPSKRLPLLLSGYNVVILRVPMAGPCQGWFLHSAVDAVSAKRPAQEWGGGTAGVSERQHREEESAKRDPPRSLAIVL